MRRVLPLTWILLCLGGTCVLLELASRWWLHPWHQEIGNRHMQPYLMSGGYYQTPVPGVRAENLITGPAGPEAYGYARKGNIYLFEFEEEVSSIADRGNFLFQDRVHLANDTKQNGAMRIFAIGGSAAYGIGASSKDHRWYAVLEQTLSSAMAREVRLIPAAMIGYVSTQERLILDWMVLPRSPDAVIIFNGFNDVALPAVFGARPGDPYDQGILYEDFYSPLFSLKKWLAKQSALYRYLMHRSFAQALSANKKRILANPELLSNYAKSTASVYLDNIKNMMDICQEAEVPCKVFLQPAYVMTRKYQGSTENLNPFVLSSYEQILKRIQHEDFENFVSDLTGIFNESGREQWFTDSVHFNDSGHKAVSDAMYPIVLDLIRRNPRLSSPLEN